MPILFVSNFAPGKHSAVTKQSEVHKMPDLSIGFNPLGDFGLEAFEENMPNK